VRRSTRYPRRLLSLSRPRRGRATPPLPSTGRRHTRTRIADVVASTSASDDPLRGRLNVDPAVACEIVREASQRLRSGNTAGSAGISMAVASADRFAAARRTTCGIRRTAVETRVRKAQPSARRFDALERKAASRPRSCRRHRANGKAFASYFSKLLKTPFVDPTKFSGRPCKKNAATLSRRKEGVPAGFGLVGHSGLLVGWWAKFRTAVTGTA